MRFGVPELVIILVIVLVIFGGAKLGSIGKTFGKTIKDFKKEIKEDDETPESEDQK
jgi:sec-independent protein translocase protein TatA